MWRTTKAILSGFLFLGGSGWFFFSARLSSGIGLSASLTARFEVIDLLIRPAPTGVADDSTVRRINRDGFDQEGAGMLISSRRVSHRRHSDHVQETSGGDAKCGFHVKFVIR